MAKRLISLNDLDLIEGLVERHVKLQEQLEELEAEAAEFDVPAQGVPELSQNLREVRLDLTQRVRNILRHLES